jgi:threonine aldolase
VSKHAVEMAMKIKVALTEVGIPLKYPVTTNQLFVELTDEQFISLSKKYVFAPWMKGENTTVARLCTDWLTPKEHVDELIKDIKAL